jgi:hypothetical protein
MARIGKILWLGAAIAISAATGTHAASVINKDTTSQTIVVEDGNGRSEISVPAGGNVDICPNGCLATFPDGENQALTGAEIIEITGKSVSIR